MAALPSGSPLAAEYNRKLAGTEPLRDAVKWHQEAYRADATITPSGMLERELASFGLGLIENLEAINESYGIAIDYSDKIQAYWAELEAARAELRHQAT